MAASMHQKQIPGQPEALANRQRFAATLKKRLEELGWNQLMLADKMGVNSSTVTRWLRGSYMPDHDGFFKLAQVVGLPVETLMTGIDPETLRLIKSMTLDKKGVVKFALNIYDQGVDLRTCAPDKPNATFTPTQTKHNQFN